MNEAPPIGTSQGLFHLTETMPVYAGSYLHRWDSPVHTHSFVEIAFAIGGTATHHSLAGRFEMRPVTSSCCGRVSGTGYEDCQRFEVYNCCFSSELLRRELAWTREDPLLGFLLWAGPYSSPGRGVLTISLDPPALSECLVHLDALAGLRHRPPALHRPDTSAAWRSCSASSASRRRRRAQETCGSIGIGQTAMAEHLGGRQRDLKRGGQRREVGRQRKCPATAGHQFLE